MVGYIFSQKGKGSEREKQLFREVRPSRVMEMGTVDFLDRSLEGRFKTLGNTRVKLGPRKVRRSTSYGYEGGDGRLEVKISLFKGI